LVFHFFAASTASAISFTLEILFVPLFLAKNVLPHQTATIVGFATVTLIFAERISDQS
jgi:hypothetical protein